MHGIGRRRNDRQAVGPAVGVVQLLRRVDVGDVVGLAGKLHGDDTRPERLPCEGEASMFTTRPEIAGTFGVVASTHWIASQVGMAVLERGGNAFDAAAATAFTLQVAEPHLNGPGGDAPIILHSARTPVRST